MLAGLRNVTEDRLQEMLNASYDSIGERLDGALERLAEIDSEAASLLSLLRNELINSLPAHPIVGLDAAELLSDAAHDLRDLGQWAEILSNAANSLNGLGTNAEILSDAAADLQALPDMVEALRIVVNDLKRYRPDC